MSFVVATALSAILVRIWKLWATHHGVFDIPNERSSHATPTVRGGGVAIVLVSAVGALVLGRTELTPPLLIFLAAAVAIALVSWIDDLRHLDIFIRLASQVAAAAVVVAANGSINVLEVPFLGSIHSVPAIAGPLTVIWIVGVTNAFNFMDGIDGIAGAQAIVGGAFWFVIASSHEEHFASILALLLAATSLGFLLHNWPPASVFMGDVGSAFLGFSFAAFAVIERPHRSLSAVQGLLILFPFLFDAAFTLIRRASRRQRIWEAHRSHLYQRLVIAGWSHGGVTMLYTGIAVAGGTAAVLMDSSVPGYEVVVAVTVIVSAAILMSLTFAAEHVRGARL